MKHSVVDKAPIPMISKSDRVVPHGVCEQH